MDRAAQVLTPTPPCSPTPAQQMRCPDSFQDAMCALAVADAEQAAAACETRAGCTGFGLLAATLASAVQPGGSDRVAILKNASAHVAAWQLTYSPLSAMYLKEGRVSPPQLPANPATADGLQPPRVPGERNATFNVLKRPQAELRALSNGCELGPSVGSVRLRVWLGACRLGAANPQPARSLQHSAPTTHSFCAVPSPQLSSFLRRT